MIAGLMSHLWHSTWFAVAVGLLTLAFRGNGARVRHALWLTASLKFFVPFSLLIGIGGHLVQQRIATRPAMPVAVERIAETLAVPVTLAAATAEASRTVDWKPLAIALVWAGGFLAVAGMRLRGWRRVRSAMRASRPLEIRAAVEIRTSPGLLEPGVVGWLRPVLLLPEGIVERLTPSQLETVLAHELCHVYRRDNLYSALHMLVEAAFWFHPLVWWIGARMVEERERACDEGVLSLGSEPQTYAEAILGVCKLYVESPLVCVSGVTGANLKQRIEAIMNNRIGHELNRAKRLLLASAGAAALAGPVVIGLVIGAGHLPVLRAQSTAQMPVTTQPAAPVLTQNGRPIPPAQPAQGARGGVAVTPTRRMLAMLLDSGALNPEELARAKQAAIQFVQTRLEATDVMSIMAANNGKVAVVQDFTDNKAALETAISGVGPTSESSMETNLSTLELAARMLGPLAGKKSLLYFWASPTPGSQYESQVKKATEAAWISNVALYAINVRQPRATPQSAQPVATFVGTPATVTTLARVFDAEKTAPANVAMFAGLPGRHSTMQTYPAGLMQVLNVPLDELTGRIDIVAEIKSVGGTSDRPVSTTVRDAVTPGTGTNAEMSTSRFTLPNGTYVASVLVRENATGRQFAETIEFEVK